MGSLSWGALRYPGNTSVKTGPHPNVLSSMDSEMLLKSSMAVWSMHYVRCGDKVSLVMSKPRVAPLKAATLPRLELIASLLTNRLLTFVRKALKLSESTPSHCWRNST